ncbi:MAG: putative transposase, partial [Verrucomicrobiales bacterium]
MLDGSAALQKDIRNHFATAIIQRCLVHKERNLRSYLSKRHHGELARLFTRPRRAQGKGPAQEVYDDLYRFLEEKNAAALASLTEAGEQITAMQTLEVP